MHLPLTNLAFLPSAPLRANLTRPLPRPLRANSVARCAATQSRRATLFTTGEKLRLHQAPPPTPNSARYIVCPNCGAAYIGNAVVARVCVKCPSCDADFHVSPELLFVQAPKEAKEKVEAPGSIVCRHMKSCAGCTVPTNAQNPPMLAEAQRFLADALYLPKPATVEMADTLAWRTHAKLAIRRGAGGPKGERIAIGLFKAHSHDVLPIPGCAVHAPEIDKAVELVREVLSKGNIAPYDEMAQRGYARYALFTVMRSTRRIQLTMVWNAASWKDAAPLAQQVGSELWRNGKNLLHSVWFNWNTSVGNAILNPERERFYHMFGERDLLEHVCGVPIAFPPYVFRQSNLDAFETMLLPRLFSYIPLGAKVAEFCAGVGVIGLTATKARKIRRLVSSEIHEAAKEEFEKAARKLKRDQRRADMRFVVGSDDETLNIIDDETDVAIFDPPRGGLSERVVETLSTMEDESSLERIIYVSCGFNALKRDARVLCQGGRWKLEAAHLYILFPGSDHVETLAIFDRVRGRRNRRGGWSQRRGGGASGGRNNLEYIGGGGRRDGKDEKREKRGRRRRS